MVNYHVFNTELKPIYMQQNNTFTSPGIIGAPELDAAKNGVLFILSTGNISVGAGSTLLLQTANPNSSKRLYISRISGGTTAAAALRIASGGTITGGSTPTAFNALFGNVTTSVATNRSNTGTLGGTPVTVMTLQLTSGMYLFDLDGGLIVPPNQSLSVTLGTGALTGSINLTWWEA